MRNLAADSGDALMLVYSLDSQESFKEVERLREEIIDKRKNVTIVIVANKTDKDISKWEVNSDHSTTLVDI